eukprot:2518973-Amphidinium_carterae.1
MSVRGSSMSHTRNYVQTKKTLETHEGKEGLYNVTSRVHCQQTWLVEKLEIARDKAAIADVMFSRGFKGIRDLSGVLSSGATCTNTHVGWHATFARRRFPSPAGGADGEGDDGREVLRLICSSHRRQEQSAIVADRGLVTFLMAGAH